MDSNKSPKEIFSADIQKDLLLLEEQEGSVNFKFGVVYMKAGQKLDDEMLSNGKVHAKRCVAASFATPFFPSFPIHCPIFNCPSPQKPEVRSLTIFLRCWVKRYG